MILQIIVLHLQVLHPEHSVVFLIHPGVLPVMDVGDSSPNIFYTTTHISIIEQTGIRKKQSNTDHILLQALPPVSRLP